MQTPWSDCPVSDAHVHFFSRPFFDSLAAQCGKTAEEVAAAAGWVLPPESAGGLAAVLGGRTGSRGCGWRRPHRQHSRRPGLGSGRRGRISRTLLRLRHGEPAGRACVRRPRRFAGSPRDLSLSRHAPLLRAGCPGGGPAAARRGSLSAARRIRALRRAHRGGAQETGPALAVRHAVFEPAGPARRGLGTSQAAHSSCRTSARAISAKP